MLGVLVNALAILTGSFVGLLAKKGIPEKITNAIMTAIALCVIYIGVSGMLKGENTLVLIVSMVLGTAVGTLLDLDGRSCGRFWAGAFCRRDARPSRSTACPRLAASRSWSGRCGRLSGRVKAALRAGG